MTECPISPTDINAASHPVLTAHTTLGVIVFSIILLIIFGALSAGLTYLDLFLATYIAQNLTARKLDRPLMTIGRLSSNDIPVPNQRVSRLHAKLRLVEGNWVLEDAESVNGIVYQGNRVERVALSNGDCIYLAPLILVNYRSQYH